MSLQQIPAALQDKYRFAERHHASAILSTDFPEEWRDLMSALDTFVLRRQEICRRDRNAADRAAVIVRQTGQRRFVRRFHHTLGQAVAQS